MNHSLADIQTINADWLVEQNITLDVLRLDKIHPVVSGNKWFKLKYYLEDAKKENKTTIATFGGAWSNHIVAASYAAKEAELHSVGIIRGERPLRYSQTLTDAERYGIELIFVTREEYKNKVEISRKYDDESWYWINEGGYGSLGVKGAAEIYSTYNLYPYTDIIAGVGTGTMLAGLISAANKDQKVTGISAMKGNSSLEAEIRFLLSEEHSGKPFDFLHDYHFGGFGKHPDELIKFMNEAYEKHKLMLDIVYTGKVFFAIKDLVRQKHFRQGSKLLMIHSGGLQGNRSVSKKLLAY